jgi:hypothetical protein
MRPKETIKTRRKEDRARERYENGCTHSEVPRVHKQCFFHVLADTHEFGQNAGALLRLVLRDNELHAGRVHPVAERRDNGQIGNAEEGVEFIFLQGLVTARTG